MSEPVRDEKWFLRAEKYSQALQNEIEGKHFWFWRRELAEPFDEYDDPQDLPPPGWKPRGLN